MRILLDGTLESSSDDHRHVPEPERTLAGVRERRQQRRRRRAGLATTALLLAAGVVWGGPGSPTDSARDRAPGIAVSQASPYPKVEADLDFASDGSFDVPLAVVRSRCEMTVDEYVRPVSAESIWDAATIPGGSDLIIENDAGRTRHCLVGYDVAARTTVVNWADLTAGNVAAVCAENVGLDLSGWGTPNTAVLATPNDFSAPSAVVALRSPSGLLAECYLVKNLPQVRLYVTPLHRNTPTLCTGISLYFTTTEPSHRIADGVVAWGVAPLRDEAGRLLEQAAFMTFSGPGLPSVAVPVEQGIVAANVSWPLPIATSLADQHSASRLVTDYTVRVIDDDGRTLASEQCGG